MACSTRARRRLSLLAGSSLAAAALVASGSALVLAPTAALAANECGGVAPTVNGTTADTFDCTGSQAAITYAASGNLTLRLNNGVTTTTGGVVVTSSGTDTVTVSRVDTPANTGDPQLTSTSAAGVSIVSTGTGAITVDLTDTDASDGVMLAVTGVTAGVQLTGGATTGTAIALTTTNGAITATGATGVGVQATSNSVAGGNTALTLGGSVSGATGVQTTVNGTGTQTVTLTATSATVSGGDVSGVAGPAVQMSAGAGASTLTVGAGRTVRADGAAMAVVEIANAGGARTITNNGTIRSNALVNPYATLAVRIGSGTGAATLTNSAGATLSGRVLLLNSGTATVANTGTWHAADFNALGVGATTLTNNAAGVIATGAGSLATTLDFQSGADTFTNAGTLAAGEGPAGTTTLTILGLETWNNSGKVLFGANGAFTASDGAANDRIVAGGAFNGSGSSKLFMDVDFTGTQADCSAAVTADCLDLRGGSVTGATSIVVSAAGAGRELAGPIVLVDVGGGSSAAARFVLDPTSAGYALNADGVGIIDAGIVHYDLAYDASAKQHALVGAPDTEAMEFAMLATSARGVWDQATGTWFDRGEDLREGGGAWLRVTGANIDQTMSQHFISGGVTTRYDTGYAQDAVALVGGVDLVRAGGSGGAWVIGLTAGHVDSDTDFTGSATGQSLRGYSLGAYSSYIRGPAFVDAIVAATVLDVSYDIPSQGAPAEDSQAKSLGFQAEGGWRLAVPDMPAFIEPLLAVSYVRTQLDQVVLPGVTASFEDVSNFRAGLGLRVFGDAAMDDWTARFSFTGRVWEEFDGQSQVALTTPAGLDLPLAYDDPSDRLGDIGFGLAALGLDERLSLQLGLRLQFKRDYENRQFNAGLRYRW